MKSGALGDNQSVASKILQRSVDVHGGQAQRVGKLRLRDRKLRHMVLADEIGILPMARGFSDARA